MRSVLGLVFAAVLLYAAFAMNPGESKAERLDALHANGIERQGTVTEIRDVERTTRSGGRRSRHTKTYTADCPLVTFKVKGEKYSFVEYDDCDRLVVGDKVTVLVDPDDPYAARLSSSKVEKAAESTSRTTWILAGAGVVFGLVSAIGLWLRVSGFVSRRRGVGAA